MTTPDDCRCYGCQSEDCDHGCYWTRGITGSAPWSPDTLDPIELPPRVVGLIADLSDRITPERVKSDPDS